jgi:hypothetical protein
LRTSSLTASTARARAGHHYLRNTVLLATVLFLTALAQRFKVHGVRVALLAVAGCLLIVALYYVVTYPVA